MGQAGSVPDTSLTGPARLVAPAKLTLSFQVTGIRSGGMHEVAAEMVCIDLHDDLVIDPGGDGLEILEGTGEAARRPAELPTDGTNLVARALDAMGRRARVVLHKRIPVGGGLGGGSADAAAILRWAECEDLATAVALGSDVPFCLVGGRAMVTGLGEVVRPLDFLERRFTLLVPPFSVPTADVYRRWDELDESGADLSGINTLTLPALDVEPRLAAWRDHLAELTRRQPILAGSGATWFVEGGLAEHGLERRAGSATGPHGDAPGRLLEVATVPAGWSGPEGTPA